MKLIFKHTPGGHSHNQQSHGRRGGSGISTDSAGRYIVPAGASKDVAKSVAEKAGWEISKDIPGGFQSKAVRFGKSGNLLIQYAGNRVHYFANQGGTKYTKQGYEDSPRTIPTVADAKNWASKGVLGQPPEDHPSGTDFHGYDDPFA